MANTFTSDSQKLVNMAKELLFSGITFFDIGCGDGTLTQEIEQTLVQRAIYPTGIYSFDIQMEHIHETKNKTTVARIIQADLRNNPFRQKIADLAVFNPPYYKKDQGLKSHSISRNIDRHELYATVEDFICFSKQVLKPGGTLLFVAPFSRYKETRSLLMKHSFKIIFSKFINCNKKDVSRTFFIARSIDIC